MAIRNNKQRECEPMPFPIDDEELARLMDELDPPVSAEEAAAIEAEWIAVAEERMRELDADPSIAIPFEVVMAESRKLLR